MPAWALTECRQCGASIDQAAKGRPRRFCSAACKQAAYRAGVTKVNRTGQDGTGHMICQAAAVAPTLAMAGPGRKDGG